jgi:enamine deaminase RidA (YjgF/YER057c/UK114 family)
MAAQFELAVDNLQHVLAAADMTRANIIRLNVYTTDFDELVKHWSKSYRPVREIRCSLCDQPVRRHAAFHARASRHAGSNGG